MAEAIARRGSPGTPPAVKGADEPLPGLRAIRAFRPVLEEWVDRKHGDTSYRLTQMLTGHGFFADFLFRIGRERSAECWYCDAPRDTADHTLKCPAWTGRRAELRLALEEIELHLADVVRAAFRGRRQWSALVKKNAEWDRERRGVGRPPPTDVTRSSFDATAKTTREDDATRKMKTRLSVEGSACGGGPILPVGLSWSTSSANVFKFDTPPTPYRRGPGGGPENP